MEMRGEKKIKLLPFELWGNSSFLDNYFSGDNTGKWLAAMTDVVKTD